MSKLSYTGKLTLSIKMGEVLKYCNVLCHRKDLQYHIKNELGQICDAIINGGFSGEGWKRHLFKQLERDEIVELKPQFYDDF